MTYEIRRGGEVICRSFVSDCGYSKEILRDMERNGMHLYCDGKKIKSRSGRSRTETARGSVPTLLE